MTWTAEGVAFLRRIVAREVYTGLSGEALARWAVGLDDRPRDRPYDRGDLARCMNVYWSAPSALQSIMRPKLVEWAKELREQADGELSWRFGGMPQFDDRRYYRREDDLDTYWGLDDEAHGARCLYYACTKRQGGSHTRWWDDWGTCSREHAEEHYGEDLL